MNWTTRLRRWWRRPPPAPRLFADPLDYALAICLPAFAGGKSTGPARPAFAALSPAEQTAVAQQLAALQELAATLGQQVNRQALTQGAALDSIWQAYPQLDRENLGSLLWQAFIATR